MLTPFKRIFKWFESQYQSDLERYISQRSPKHNGDVERLTIEYHSHYNRKYY